MAVTTHSRTRIAAEPSWTPRQREVLDLLVRGLTNGQIAGRLQISLDGAKWHVSEIITKLGVDTRDEAAEYWRHRNGLRMRFTRVISAVFGGPAFKWTVATAGVLATAVVAVAVIAALHDGGTSETDSGVSVPPGDVGNPPDPANPGNSAPPPSNVTGERVGGIDVRRWTVVAPASLPPDFAVIIEKGCFQCDGHATAIERLATDADRTLTTTTLFTAPGAPAAYISSSNVERPGDYYVTVCSRGYCGGAGEATPDAQTTVYRSVDGGVSWQVVKTLDGSATVAAVTADGPVLDRSSVVGGKWTYRYEVMATGKLILPPVAGEPWSGPVNNLVWRSPNRQALYALDGTLIYQSTLGDHPYGEAGVNFATATVDGATVISWMHGKEPKDLVQYQGIVRDGKLAAVFTTEATGTGLVMGRWLNDHTLIGNATISEAQVKAGGSAEKQMLHPVLVDLDKGTMTPLELYGPAFSEVYRDRNYVRGVLAGPALTVTGAGDCLNVRESASTTARSLGCFKDNVLLPDRGQMEQAGGITWAAVRTPSGQEGWASRQYLR